MTFGFEQLLAHLVGDYLLQSDWVATHKYTETLDDPPRPNPQGWAVALIHAILYALPFAMLLMLTRPGEDVRPGALLVISGTHYGIDHYRLGARIAWVKNFIYYDIATPPKSWVECAKTGSDPARPIWLTVWLSIIIDNTLHLLCNYAALRWL